VPLSGRQKAFCGDAHRKLAFKRRLREAKRPARPKVRAIAKAAPAAPAAPKILGYQEPRIRLEPPRSGSKADEAVAMARSTGLVLDPWQERFLEAAMGTQKGSWAASQVVLLVARQSGKTQVTAVRAVWEVVHAPDRTVVYTSHLFKSDREAFRACRRLLEHEVFAHFEPVFYRSNGNEAIELNNGSRIQFLARKGGSGRGFTAHLLVLDEAFDLDEETYADLTPSTVAAEDSQTWVVSSAPHPNSEVLRRVCGRGRAGEDPFVCYWEFSAADDAPADSLEAWRQANPGLGLRIMTDDIASRFADMPRATFEREFLSRWSVDDSPSPFPPGSWDALVYQGHLDMVGTPCFSVDVTPARDHSTIAFAANTDAGRPLVEVVETQRGTSWVVPKLQEILERYRGAKVIVDRSAWAASLADDIRAANLAVHETDASEVSTAAGQFLEATLEQKFFHRGDPRLTSAVEGSRQRPIGERWGWDRKIPTVDVSPLIAASLALWGLRTFKPATQYFWSLTTSEERAQQVDPTGWVIAPRAVHPTEIGALFNNG
jgi:Terminase large subunit, T4likevirus-type, N-terminal